MKRYIVKTWVHADELFRHEDIDGTRFVPNTVFERETVVRKTGLLDKDGNPILITEAMDPIGFIRR